MPLRDLVTKLKKSCWQCGGSGLVGTIRNECPACVDRELHLRLGYCFGQLSGGNATLEEVVDGLRPEKVGPALRGATAEPARGAA